MRFLGNVLSTIVGIFLFCMIFFFGLIFIAALFSSNSTSTTVKSDSVIELDLSKVTNDYGGKFIYKDFNQFEDRHDGLSDVIAAIEAAKTDSNIKGISILNDVSSIGMAQIKSVRDALEDFKSSGKFVYAYSNSYTQKEYYLNSVANTIYLNPVGDFDFKGLSSEILFFKELQEKSGINIEVIRHGKYKSAVEPFLENEMSAANREQTSGLLNSIWGSVLADISQSRKVPASRLNEIANGLLARTPEMAKNEKLVDQIAYEDVYHDDIRKMLKIGKEEEYNKISILDYAEDLATTSADFTVSDRIAIIYAQGEIGSGEGDISTVGEGSMKRSLREARLDDNIKAIVLRIDSPGGSALTSDLIWREIELTKKVKPVVVSMGNLAASGGYYIACNADKIFAENNTITGSIGVFGILPNLTNLTNKIGIHSEVVSTNTNAAGYSPFRPIDENFKKVTQEGVERIYTVFVSRVAEGRKMTFEAVDAIAQGRVWSGSEAVKIGLVDQIGGMDDALAYAAKITKTKNYRTENYPEYEKNFLDYLGNLGIPFLRSNTEFLKSEIGTENYKLLEQIKNLSAKTGIQAAMPFTIKID